MGPMLRWFVFTIGFGLLPFGFRLLLEALHSSRVEPWNNTPELLFFCVMVCGVEMGEIFCTFSSETEMGPVRARALSIAFCVLMLFAFIAAGLYGIYMDQERLRLLAATECARMCATSINGGVDALDFQQNVYRLSIWLSALLGVGATALEWLRTRRK
ncbi:MAG TPA: hypothetical protein VFQ45_18130 [Longimicrobium sp.]|nr:hypothetical protein [Longimicrobium sp.]